MSEPKTRQISITLVRSPIGTPREQRVVVRSLGLRRIRHTVLRPDTPEIRGLVNAVRHLIRVTEAEK